MTRWTFDPARDDDDLNPELTEDQLREIYQDPAKRLRLDNRAADLLDDTNRFLKEHSE